MVTIAESILTVEVSTKYPTVTAYHFTRSQQQLVSFFFRLEKVSIDNMRTFYNVEGISTHILSSFLEMNSVSTKTN